MQANPLALTIPMYADTSCLESATPRMQRAEGTVRVSIRQRAGASRLETLFQEGCGKARLPTPAGGLAPEIILINTSGGLTGGDRFSLNIDIQPDARATVTTQACERIYRSTGDDARVTNTLKVAAGSRLAWLPQETILFDGGKLARRLEVDLEAGSELLAVEAVLFGRAAMGETVKSGSLHDRWRVRQDGRLIFADDFRVLGDVAGQLSAPVSIAGKNAMATVLLCAPEPEQFLDSVRAIIGDDGGASAWNGKLLVRIVCENGLALRRRLEPLLSLLNHGEPLPKVWRL
jgi:urease accessory protein